MHTTPDTMTALLADPSQRGDEVQEQPSEDALIAADLAEDAGKSARRHAVNDSEAMRLQLQGTYRF